jgi:cbb3-type cytochrome oxidase subunit 3
VIFFLVFVSVSLYALTRKKKDVARWARIAIEDDVVTPRGEVAADDRR